MPLEFSTHRSGPVTDLSDSIAQFRFIEHFFDIAKLIGPFGKLVARQWTGAVVGGATTIAFSSAAKKR